MGAVSSAASGFGHRTVAVAGPQFGAAIGVAVLLHAAVLLLRPVTSTADHREVAAVMQVRSIAAVPVQAAEETVVRGRPPQARNLVESSEPASALARETAERRPQPAVPSRSVAAEQGEARATARPAAPWPMQAESAGETSGAAPVVPALNQKAAVAQHSSDPGNAREARAAAEAALPPAPDYLFGARLDPGPRPLDDIDPTYPAAANLQEGTVVLRLLVSETGALDNVAVVRAEPRGLFEAAALEAFSKARFAPGLVLGRPVKSQITIEVHFLPINRGARISGRGY